MSNQISTRSIRRRSHVTQAALDAGSAGVLDSVRSSQSMYETDHRHMPLLMATEHDWQQMRKWRRDRERNKRFYFGDQWSDMVTVGGRTMRMDDYLKDQGSIPLKTNLIRRLGNSVMGVQLGQRLEPTCIARDRDEQKLGEMMTTALEYVRDHNDMELLEMEQFQEFLISGLALVRKRFGWRGDEYDVWTEACDQRYFFVDSNMKDPRHSDVRRLGYMHDYTWGELVHEFAFGPGGRKMVRRLEQIYETARNRETIFQCCEQFGHKRLDSINFLVPRDPTLFRVIEVWTKETKARYRCHDDATGETYRIEKEDYREMVEMENEKRLSMAADQGIPEDDVALIDAEWFVDDYWYCRWLAPTGEVLREYESPFSHKGHPYVFVFYPFVDGEVHSFVSDVIDQQIYVNRLITMQDFIMRSSAKGVLLVPEDCIPDNMDINSFSDAWAKFNGVLMISARAGSKMPTQVAQNATNIGIGELLNLQLKFFEDISGVHGALQGATPTSGTSGKLYEQQMANGATSLLPLLQSYSWFVKESARKDVANIQQCYDESRMINIGGKSVYYEAWKMQELKFDLKIGESQNTTTYRQMADQMLQSLFEKGVITVQELLKHCSYPMADALLQDVNARMQSQQDAAAQQAQSGVGGMNGAPVDMNPQLLEAAQRESRANANIDAVNMAKQTLQNTRQVA